MTKDEALRLALDAFGEIAWSNQTQWQSDRAKVAITTIQAALEAKNEPVVGTKTWFEDGKVVTQNLYYSDVYTTPSQRKPLTYEELESLVKWYGEKDNLYFNRHEFARAIEAAHGIEGEA